MYLTFFFFGISGLSLSIPSLARTALHAMRWAEWRQLRKLKCKHKQSKNERDADVRP